MLFMLLTLTLLQTTAEPEPILLEFRQTSEIATERLTLFDNGTVILKQKGPGDHRLERLRQLSSEELGVYLAVVEDLDVSSLPDLLPGTGEGPFSSRMEISARFTGGTRTFRGSTMDVPPLEIGRLLAVVGDLRTLLLESGPDTHPCLTRAPQIGDLLEDHSGRIFRVKELRRDDGVYLLEGVEAPLSYEMNLDTITAFFRGYADPGR